MLLAAPCPANVANALASPPPLVARQLVTVTAPSEHATYATARLWRRLDGCWSPAGGPYTARVGRNGVRVDKREGDGATPAGTFPIGSTMYGNSPDPGVRFRYVRLRCGDWWVEDARSAAKTPSSASAATGRRRSRSRRPTCRPRRARTRISR